MNGTTEKATPLGSGIYHPSARPMEVAKDDRGDWWLCDKGVDRTSRTRVAGGAASVRSQETTDKR
jgi:hypothetical protein